MADMFPSTGNLPSLSELMATIKRPQPTRKPTIKSKEYVEDSGSQEESDSQSESDSRSQTGDQTSPVRRSGSAARSVSSSDSKEEDESQSSAATSHAEVSEESPPAKRISKSQSATPFEPPCGFQAISGAFASTSPALRLFTSNALAGKQIWHITAPAAVPIGSIKEVAIASVREGEAIVKHEGANYGFVMDKLDGLSKPKLLVPCWDNDGYRQVQPDITQKLHLQQIIRPPDVSNRLSQAAAAPRVNNLSSPLPAMPVREQPRGLRMRYLPTGFGEGEAGRIGSSSSSADNTDEDSQPQFRVIKESPLSLSSAKMKKADPNRNKGDLKASSKESPRLDGPPNKKSKHSNKQSEDLQQSLSTVGGLATSEPQSVDISRQKRQKGQKSGNGNSIPLSSMGSVAGERKEPSREASDGDGLRRKKDKHKHKSNR
ncbi:MAG: hypothetical protein M1836_000237 [Candelina mexicana]|nr:MAG: hypothetical protein M1836_000237 [Candelina mexicana]